MDLFQTVRGTAQVRQLSGVDRACFRNGRAGGRDLAQRPLQSKRIAEPNILLHHGVVEGAAVTPPHWHPSFAGYLHKYG